MAWRRGSARWGRTRGPRAARRGRRPPGAGRPGGGTRPFALRPLLAVAFIAAAVAMSLAGPARIGAALREAAAQWWAVTWSQVKGEGVRVLPAMRARLRDDPRLARSWLEQGLPAPAPGTSAAPNSLEEWEQEVRRLVARVAAYDADDPRTLLARHLGGGMAPGPPSVPADTFAAGAGEPAPPVAPPAALSTAPPVQPVPAPVPPQPEPRPLLRSPGETGSAEAAGESGDRGPGAGTGGAGGVAAEAAAATVEVEGGFTVGRAGVPENPWMAAVRRSVSWGEGPLVGIYHSHTSEMYRTDDFFPPHPHDYHRFGTPDTGIVRVGEALAERLRAYGIGVVHSRRVHDAPVHALAYRRSRETVQEMLDRFPTLEIILDVHRDAPEGLTAVVAGQTVGQVMLLVGSGQQARGLANPHWQRNLALARELEAVMEQRFPGLHRRTWVRGDARFNQDLHPGMLLVEIGSYDTHLDEAVAAARLLGDALAEALWRRRAGGTQGIAGP